MHEVTSTPRSIDYDPPMEEQAIVAIDHNDGSSTSTTPEKIVASINMINIETYQVKK